MVTGLYVGNVPYWVTYDELWNLFSGAGTVVFAQIFKDESGRSRGFGYVEMKTDAEAYNVLEVFNGFSFGGRQLRVWSLTFEQCTANNV